MSVDCISWSFKMQIEPTPRFVLLAISDRADKKHGRYIAWPSYRDIMERTGYSPSTVKRAVAQLLEWGLMSREKRKGLNGRNTSNLYILHIDREPPPEVVEACIRKIQGSGDSQENTANTDASDESDESIAHSDTREGWDSCEPRDRTPVRQANKKHQLETPPISPEIAENKNEQLHDTFRQMVEFYQQANLIAFLGDEQKAWKAWPKMREEDRAKALSRLQLYLQGKKAQFAKWKNEPREHRNRKPPNPAPLCDYLRTALFETVGSPVVADVAEFKCEKALCRQIIQRNAPAAEHDFQWPFWHKVGSAEYEKWDLFFRLNGFEGAPQRKAAFSEMEIMPKLGWAGAKWNEIGWRFPTEWPPEFDEHAIDAPQQNEKAMS